MNTEIPMQWKCNGTHIEAILFVIFCLTIIRHARCIFGDMDGGHAWQRTPDNYMYTSARSEVLEGGGGVPDLELKLGGEIYMIFLSTKNLMKNG